MTAGQAIARALGYVGIVLLPLLPLGCTGSASDGPSASGTSGRATGGGNDIGGQGGATSTAGATGTGGSATAGGPEEAGTHEAQDAGGDEARPPAAPITAPIRTWTWIDFPGAHCRDGTPTGIGVNWVPGSKKLVMFLQGGGACFSVETCAMNPAARNSMFGGGGIFDRSKTDNPFADWNQVYVPYCTGDFYAGNNPAGNVPGVGPQQFVGYADIDLFLDRLVATFPDATQVVLTGSSAGGLGTFFNAAHFARRFGAIPIVALDDSGPPLSGAGLPTCFQKVMRQLWSLDSTVLADCGADCPKQDDYLLDLTVHFGKGATHATAMLNSYDDAVDIAWYNYGRNTCATAVPALTTMGFEAALLELRQTGGGAAKRFATYYLPATSHTWLGDQFYGAIVKGTRLPDWTRDLLSGTYRDVGP